jgi:hypothetical protein
MAAGLLSELHRTRHARALERRPVRPSLKEVRGGERVRVRGRVEPSPDGLSVGSRWNAVLAHYIGRIASVSGGLLGRPERRVQELRGRAFRLRLADGDSITVDVADAVLLSDNPLLAQPRFLGRPIFSRVEDEEQGLVVFVYAEDVIGPGDEIEVLGTVDLAVDPKAEAGYRGSRLAATLRGTRLRPLIIRRAGRRR